MSNLEKSFIIEEKEESYLPLAMTVGMFSFFLTYDPHNSITGMYGFFIGIFGTLLLIVLLGFILMITEKRKKTTDNSSILTTQLIQELNEIVQQTEQPKTITIKINLKKNQHPTLQIENYGRT